jgi:hypothetical protein
MKRGCSHRWRDVWEGHAGLRPSPIAHAYSKTTLAKRTLARRAAGAHGIFVSGSGAVETTGRKPLAKGSAPPAFLLKAKGYRFGADIGAAAAVEFALILWPLLLMVLGAVDGGRMLWTQNSLQYAVEQAARCAVVNTTTCGTPSQIKSYATSMAYGMSLSPSVFSSSSAGCGAVAGTQVSASYLYSPLFPFPHNVTLTASSCRPT